MPNWELRNCCNHEQVVFLTTIAIFTVVVLALWRTILLTPFKLITVFLHETSHAIACKLTCGHAFRLAADKTRSFLELIWAKNLLHDHGLKAKRNWKHQFSHTVTCDDVRPWHFSSTGVSLKCFPSNVLDKLWRVRKISLVEGIQVHANEGGVTQTRGGVYCLILPAGYLGSSFWGMVFILASTNLLTARIAAGCFAVALLIVLFVAKNWTLRGLCIGFIIFLGIIWLLQETTKIHILRYIILFIGVMNSLFSVYDIYDDLISRRVHSSDAEKFAEVCPCPCNGVAWGVIWGLISFMFLCGAMYLGLVIMS